MMVIMKIQFLEHSKTFGYILIVLKVCHTHPKAPSRGTISLT
jgi:hypothetical protein